MVQFALPEPAGPGKRQTWQRKKVLVVFYSRTGTTRKIAKALGTELTCDVDEIIAHGSRIGSFGIMRSLIEAMRQQQPAPIAPTKLDPSSYDLVIIGMPVWAWSASSPTRGYLLNNAKKLPQIAFFCTLGNRGGERAFAQMQSLAGKAPRSTVAFKTQDVIAGRFLPRLKEFAKGLRSPNTNPQ